MPWTPSDASAKTRKANTPAAKKAWAKTANAVLERTGDEGQAVRVANSGVAKSRKSDTPKASPLRGALRGTY